MSYDKFKVPSGVDVKTLRLCGQVADALTAAFAGECADEVSRLLGIEHADPYGSRHARLSGVDQDRGGGSPQHPPPLSTLP